MKTKPCISETTTILAGQQVTLDPSGALFLPDEDVLVFSDLHFEKGSSYAKSGLFLPPYDTRTTIKAVAAVAARYKPSKVISLGDAFHDMQAEARMQGSDFGALAELVDAYEWIWVLGNHDPQPPTGLGGAVCESITIAGLVMRHQPEGEAPWNLIGHYHPVAKVVTGGRGMRRKCFLSDGGRMIMPSFGAYTGGLNILDDAYAGLMGDDLTVHMLGREAVYQVCASHLRPDCVEPVSAQRI